MNTLDFVMADTPKTVTPPVTPVPDGVGTDHAVRQTQRHGLPAGYPADLSRSSEPSQGSIADGSMPIRNRESPWRGMKGGR